MAQQQVDSIAEPLDEHNSFITYGDISDQPGGAVQDDPDPMNNDEPTLCSEPSAPPEEEVHDQHWYPQLQPNPIPEPGANGNDMNIINNHFEDPQPMHIDPPIQDDEKKDAEAALDPDDGAYEMCEGIQEMPVVDVVSLQPEGKAVAPSEFQVKAKSFTPKAEHKINVAAVCKRLYGTIGLFKSKQKRINAFTEMAISTNRAQRQELRKYYLKKYQVPLIGVIQKLSAFTSVYPIGESSVHCFPNLMATYRRFR